MDWFGITVDGVSSEIAFASKPGFCERSWPPPRPPGCPRRWLDSDLPRADGLSLGSSWRRRMQRRAGLHDPHGPLDRFRFPVTTSMDYGWALVDPAFEDTHFLCAEADFRHVSCDVVKNLEERLKCGVDPLLLHTRAPVPLRELNDKFVRILGPSFKAAKESPLLVSSDEEEIKRKQKKDQRIELAVKKGN